MPPVSYCIFGLVMLSAAAIYGTAAPEQNPAPAQTHSSANSPALDTRDSPAESGQAGPQLHSVGVRGAIDSGGYSASAAAKSQSALIGDMLKLQHRELSRFYQPNGNLSCGKEPEILGLAQERLGRFESAEQQFRLASASSPNEQNFFAWGTALLIMGNSDRAADVFKTATRRFPPSIALTIGLGAATYSEGRSSDALKIFLRAAEFDPSNGAPYIFMARIFGAADAVTTADEVEELKRLVQTAPDNPEANYAYACSLESNSRNSPNGPQSQEVEHFLKRSIALKPMFADAHFQLAAFYADRGDYQLAITEYSAAIEANPNLIEAHYRLAQAYLRTGQRDMAERELALHQRLREAQNQGLQDANTDSASPCPAH